MAEDYLGKAMGIAAGSNPIASIKEGMGLAQSMQQIEGDKITLENKKNALEEQKLTSGFGLMKTLARSNPKIAKQMLPRIQEQLNKYGLNVDPVLLDSLASDEEWKRKWSLVDQQIQGKLSDPAIRAQASMALADFMEADKAVTMMHDSEKTRVQEANATRRQELAASAERYKIDGLEGKQQRDLQTYLNKAKTTVDSTFKDLDKSKQSVRDARASLDKIMDVYSKGGNTAEFRTMFDELIRKFARAANGAGVMTDADVQPFAQTMGFEGKLEDFKNKWITGDVDMKKLQQLQVASDMMADNLDRNIADAKDKSMGMIRNSTYADKEAQLVGYTGLDKYSEPTFKPKDSTRASGSPKQPANQKDVLEAMVKDPNVPAERKAQAQKALDAMNAQAPAAPVSRVEALMNKSKELQKGIL